MLFTRIKRRKYHITPTWSVACGSVDSLKENVAWRDNNFAAILPGPEGCYALSQNQRFVVVGDAWLANKEELEKKLGIAGNGIEIIANLWDKFGASGLTQLVGLFAIAIWDRETRVLNLIRDRVGGRTLYYTTTGSTCFCAPSLRTIAPYRSSELDLIALRDYLCCAFVPGLRTLWQDVREVRPGTVVDLPSNKANNYWQLQEDVTAPDRSLAWHGDRLRTLLNQVVQEYLPPNEAVGVFLSGGLDSSSITALVAKLHNAPVHTFSIHFGAECPNELEFSSLVAEHCQTQHHILEITFEDMWSHLPETMAYLDDPIGDPLTVPNLLVGRLAREYVQVILNGEGGDPCFGGPKNQPMLINNLYGSVTNQDPLQAYLTSFNKCANDLPQLLKPEVFKAVQNAPSIFSDDLNSQMNYLNRLMAINIKFKGADQILTKVNNLTSAAKLDGRSPLFDQRVVDLSMEIPPEYKLSGVEEKAVLKQAIADIVPEKILNRPKSGMMVPVQLGFRKYWQKAAKDLLLNKKSEISNYLNDSIIRDWLNYRGDVWSRYGVKLWLLVSLEIWLQVNKK